MSITREGFETQVMAMLGRLHGVATRLTRNDTDAEDLVAEAIARAWRARESLTTPDAFPAWIFRILNNTFISDRRRASVRGEIETTDSVDEARPFSIFERLHQPFLLWFSNPEQEFLDKLLRDDVDRALAALPEHYRVVVILADMEDLKYAEVADVLQIPIGTVRSRLARARAALQEALWDVARDRGMNVPLDDARGRPGVPKR
jgi:RNA polymerase sigma-70 factor (ECF subfamily)